MKESCIGTINALFSDLANKNNPEPNVFWFFTGKNSQFIDPMSVHDFHHYVGCTLEVQKPFKNPGFLCKNILGISRHVKETGWSSMEPLGVPRPLKKRFLTNSTIFEVGQNGVKTVAATTDL